MAREMRTVRISAHSVILSSRIKMLMLFCFIILINLNLLFGVKICPKCGKEYPDSESFCDNDGQPLLKKVKIPNVVGQDKIDAVGILQTRGFVVISHEISVDDEKKANKVVFQTPRGERLVKGESEITVTLEIGIFAQKSKLTERAKSPSFWPEAGKSVFGIKINDTKNIILDSIGNPDSIFNNLYYYSWEDNNVIISFVDDKVDAITVFMSPTQRENFEQVIAIIRNLYIPEEADSIHQAYYRSGITLFQKSDTVIGFKIFPPRTEPLWSLNLKKFGIDLTNLSVCGLSIGTYSDSINLLLNKPNNETNNSMIYEYQDDKLVFVNVGGEIDTIELFLNQNTLFEIPLNPKNQTREAFLKNFGDPGQTYYNALIYDTLGFAVSFDDQGIVKFIKLFHQKYHNMVYIPEGTFLVGITKKDAKKIEKEFKLEKGLLDDEMPQKQIYLKSYYIDKYEVTNRQYQKFIKATNYKPQGDWRKAFTPRKENHPVVAVTLDDAIAYVNWAGKRIPTELEWEKAARCSLGYFFPWGNDTNAGYCANYDSPEKGTVTVSSYAEGQSPYGVFNMAGNVWEWCSNEYRPDYYKLISTDNQEVNDETFYVNAPTVVRGGSYSSKLLSILSTYRYHIAKVNNNPEFGFRYDLGFRCVKDLK
jgi:formylglycine-generating enzyme required for sulfatase activity